MAQKKKVSVSSVTAKATKDDEKVAPARAKPVAAKKAAVKAAAPKKAAVKSTSQTKAAVGAAKSPAKKVAAKKTTAAKKTVKASPAKKVAAKTAAKNSPAAKAAASTKSKIVAAAQMVAARRAAAAKAASTKAAPGKAAPAAKSAGRPLKAVAAAAPANAKRSSAPVEAKSKSGPEAAAAPKKPLGAKHGFKLHEYVVYPAHGVGQIVGIEEQEIAGMTLELFVITFDKDKMTLRVPTAKVEAMRKLSETAVVDKAMHTLKGRARVKRTMWSRRAQEYENKINSGDLIYIAEVVRDLYRSESQPEQSYSERQLYEAALDRMARELAAVEKLDERGAVQRITDVLSKSAKGRRQAEEDKAEAEAAAAAAAAASDENGDGAAAA